MSYPYWERVAIGFDQLLNTIFDGMPDETLSARSHRLSVERGRHLPKRIINLIFFWQDDHCAESYESEVERKQLPESYR